jgi:hypothetical protein
VVQPGDTCFQRVLNTPLVHAQNRWFFHGRGWGCKSTNFGIRNRPGCYITVTQKVLCCDRTRDWICPDVALCRWECSSKGKGSL